MSNPTPVIGGKAADRPMAAGGAREAGPGSSGLQFIPEWPKCLEGFFITGPESFWNYTELYDENGPEGLKTRPVPDGFTPSNPKARVSERALAPFVLTKVYENAATNPPQFREVKLLVPVKLPKKLAGDIRSHVEMNPGIPLPNMVVRLTRSGKGLNTEYKLIPLPVTNPDLATIPSHLSSIKLSDGRPLQGDDLVVAWLGERITEEFYNFDPTNPANVAAGAARAQQFNNGGQAQMQAAPVQPMQPNPVPQGMQTPSSMELMAYPLKQLRDLAIQHGIVPPTVDAASFKANKSDICLRLAFVLSQQAA